MLTAEKWRERVFAAFPRETYRHDVAADIEFWRTGDGFRTEYKGVVFVRASGQPAGSPSPCAIVDPADAMADPETALAALREQVAASEAEWVAWEAEHGPAREWPRSPEPPEPVVDPAPMDEPTEDMPF